MMDDVIRVLYKIHPRHTTLIRLFYAFAENVKRQKFNIFAVVFLLELPPWCIRPSPNRVEWMLKNGREHCRRNHSAFSLFFLLLIIVFWGPGALMASERGRSLILFETMLYYLTRSSLPRWCFPYLPFFLLLLTLTVNDIRVLRWRCGYSSHRAQSPCKMMVKVSFFRPLFFLVENEIWDSENLICDRNIK